MKIATNVQRDAFGGITISNLALFDWLARERDTIVGVEYLVARHVLGPAVFRHYDPSFFRHHIVNAIDVFSRFPWQHAWGSRSLRRRWHVLVEETKKVLVQEAPDVVLLNGTYYAPWILATAAVELGIPTVLRYAGVLQREVAHWGLLPRRRLLAYERWIAGAADAIIYPSSLCRQVVEREILGRRAPRSVVIPNPIAAWPRIARRRRARFTMAAVGRWTRIKNFQAFIAAHESLRSQHWPHRAILVTSYKDPRFPIPESIERREPMGHEELQAFFRGVDLLVVPSHFETFSNVTAEALAQGTPVLVSEAVGIAEILRKAGLGRMVIRSFDDPATVAAAIRRLSRTRITARERAALVSLLDSHRIHGRILGVLQGVLRGPAA